MRVRKRRSRSHSKGKGQASKDKFDPSTITDPLFSRLEEILRPLDRFPYRVRITSVGKQEIEKGKHWTKKVVPIIQAVCREAQIRPSEVEAILLQWWNPVDIGAIERIASAIKESGKQVQREIRLRNTILNTVSRLSYPSIPAPLALRLRVACDLALEILTFEQSCYRNAEGVLRAAGASVLTKRNERRRFDKEKPRTGMTRWSILALHKLLKPTVRSLRRRSVLIHQLLSSWNDKKAPPNPDAIRAGYKESPTSASA
jgi:hypothetical protein